MDLFKSAIDGQVQALQNMLGVKETKVNEQDEAKMTPLHYAAWYNKLEVVETLLQHGADSNAQDKDASTPLHYAARYKQRTFQTAAGEVVTSPSSRKVIRMLVEHAADVNASNVYGDTPLSMAVVRDNKEAVEELLGTPGINLEISDKRKWTALHLAAKFQRLSIGKILLREGAAVRARTERQLTPLMLAAAEGNLNFIQLLLKNAINAEEEYNMVNDNSLDDESALDFAVENKKRDVIDLLLQKGAKVRKTCRSTQMSPLHLSANAGGPRIAKMLLEQDKLLVKWITSHGATPLHIAAQQGKGKVVKVLLENGADIEAKDNDNFTPLLTAVEHGMDRATKVLLEGGANISALTKSDQSAIHLAAKHNRVTCLQLLLQHVANDEDLMNRIVSADDRLGNSPLHLAAEKGFTDTVKVLMKHQADLENINEEEELPIHVAARCGKTEVVLELLDSKEDNAIINNTQEDGDTPLHLAATGGHIKVIEALLSKGADASIRNRQFWTPLACAASSGWADVVELLLKRQAEISPKDRIQRTPLHLAALNGHVNVVRLLLEHGASVADRDNEGCNPLDVAIQYSQKHVAMAIVDSDHWKEAMRNRTIGNKSYSPVTTPLRKLIRKMPDVVEKLFDNCVQFPTGLDMKDPDLEIEMDFEFLDDTYSCAAWGDPNLVHVQNTQGQVYNSDGTLDAFAKPYTTDSFIREANHPLQTLVDCKCAQLLYHPLVLGLVRQKWRLAQVSYFSFLAFYTIFVAIFTWFMVAQKPPFYYNNTLLEESRHNQSLCEPLWDTVQESTANEPHPTLFMVAAVVVWVMCAMGVSVELMQMYSTPARYFTGGTNLLDWFTYISVAVVMMPLHPCNIAYHWQWQLGTAAMFAAWMDLILFLRRLPGVGIYVVMVGEVFITFVKFFVFCFSLFIFAFGFTFYVLLRNQAAFESPGYAFMKTGVMMIGEIEFEGLFHGEQNSFDTSIFYEELTSLIFICFLCMATIIIMNLLTGLAVGDVQDIQEQARLKKLAMQVELALDVEVSLTEPLRRYFRCVIGSLRIRPNKLGTPLLKKVGQFMSGPLSSRSIAAALYTEVEEQTEEQATHAEEQEALPTAAESSIIAQVTQNSAHLQVLGEKMERIENMMQMLLERVMVEDRGQDDQEPQQHPVA